MQNKLKHLMEEAGDSIYHFLPCNWKFCILE